MTKRTDSSGRQGGRIGAATLRETAGPQGRHSKVVALKEPTGPVEPHAPGVDCGVLDTLVGYSVRRAQMAIHDDFVLALAPWHMTPQRFSALTIISRNANLKLTQLAHILGIARSGAVLLVDALAAMGYVERRPSPQDRRAYGLALTPKGVVDLRAITEAVHEHDRRIAACMSADDLHQLTRLLKLVTEPRS